MVAIGPYRLMPNHCGRPSTIAGASDAPGLTPTTPHTAEGIRIEPSPSEPSAIGTTPADTAAAEPPEDPPAVREGSHGLTLVPVASSEVPQTASSGARVLPIGIAPAARSRATTGSSSSTGSVEAPSEPCPVASPARSATSLTATGTPASGSCARSARASTAAASSSAARRRTDTNAPRRCSTPARWSRWASTTSTARTRPSATAAAISIALAPTQPVAVPGRAGRAPGVVDVVRVVPSLIGSIRPSS